LANIITNQANAIWINNQTTAIQLCDDCSGSQWIDRTR